MVRTGGLGDLDRLARRLEAARVVELEGVQAGQTDVGHRQLARRSLRLEHVAGPFVLDPGEVGSRALPHAAAEDDPVARGVEQLAEPLEGRHALVQRALRRPGLAVERVVAADPADDHRVLERIGDVRQHALEQCAASRNAAVCSAASAVFRRTGTASSKRAAPSR